MDSLPHGTPLRIVGAVRMPVAPQAPCVDMVARDVTNVARFVVYAAWVASEGVVAEFETKTKLLS